MQVFECVGMHVHMPVCGNFSGCLSMCVCSYAAILHGDSIPRLWLSTGLSLAVTSHHLLVIETAEERPAYEQWGDEGRPGAEWQILALNDCALLGPLLSSLGSLALKSYEESCIHPIIHISTAPIHSPTLQHTQRNIAADAEALEYIYRWVCICRVLRSHKCTGKDRN